MKKLLLAAFTSAVISGPAWAEDTRTIEQSFNLENSLELEIDFPVGSLEMTSYDGDQIHVTIRLEPKDNDGWFTDKVDLSAVKLKSSRQRQELSLSIDDDNLEQTWEVKVPKSMRLDVEVGVGKIEIQAFENNADVEVGVGKVRIDTAIDDFKQVNLESGVGKTSLSGLVGKAQSHKQMVSSQTEYFGSGQYTLEVEVGVGNIKVRH
tara:strand:- start:915 stop:1535 length:621 start_codon:yes stop_codon:yes gene_type:complete